VGWLGMVLGVLVAAIAEAAPFNLKTVESIHHTSVAEYTRIVITLSGETPHQLTAVPGNPMRHLPARIAVDFVPAQIGAGVAARLVTQDGLLRQVRTGQFSPTTARVVLELERFEDYKTFALHSPYRLVIDVKGNAQGKRAPVRPPDSTRRYKIMLDPGHGGHDPGASGIGRIEEKALVLALSKLLAAKLQDRLPLEVTFTRAQDVYVPLEERTAQANAAQADLFVSIHANASTNLTLQGIETYYLNNTNDRATIRLAALENGLRRPNGSERREASLSYVLSDLIQNGKAEDSIALAHFLQEGAVAKARGRYATVRNLGVKKGPFYVLMGAHMPCVLVEVGFITNPLEGSQLLSLPYHDALAEGLFEGIARFLRRRPSDSNL
jgi:N-acetylmuramoyl-L-alanine amidase